METVKAIIDLALELKLEGEGAELNSPTQPYPNSSQTRIDLIRDLINQLPHQLNLEPQDLEALNQLHPNQFTEIWVHLLSRFLKGIENSSSIVTGWLAILPNLYQFVTNFNSDEFPQLYSRFESIAKSVDKICISYAENKRVLYLQSARILGLLITRGNFGDRLTRIHPLALKHAILAKVYRHALPLAKIDPTRVILESPVKLSDYTMYYFYAGLIHLNLSLYEEASELFEQVLVIPSQEDHVKQPSIVQVEAYYKYVLLGLILKGRVPPTPKIGCKYLKGFTRRFDKIVSDYQADKVDQFIKEFRADERLSQSCNLGLAKRCVKSHARRVVRKLPNLYTRLSFNDIEAMFAGAHPHPLENLLLDLIERGELVAEISYHRGGGGGMVHLLDTPEEFSAEDELATFSKLHAAIQATDALGQLTQRTCQASIVECGMDESLYQGGGSYPDHFN